jgi:hypothetical protein
MSWPHMGEPSKTIEFLAGAAPNPLRPVAKSQALTAHAAMGLLQLQMPGARND